MSELAVTKELKNDTTLTVVKSKFISWAFSYKKSGKVDNVKSSDYLHILSVLKKHGNVTRNYFEKDPKGKWHIHGVIELHKGFYRAKLCVGGYSVHFKEIWNEAGWEDYMRKDQLLKDNAPPMVQETPGPLKDEGPCACDASVCVDPDMLSVGSEPSPTSMLKRPEIQSDLHYLFGETFEPFYSNSPAD